MKKAAQAASHSFETKFMMKSITVNFYNLFRAFFSLILIVPMLCPASFAGSVGTVWSTTDSFQQTRESSTPRGAETLVPLTDFSNLAAATTFTSVNSNFNPSIYGQPVTFFAHVSSGIGTPTTGSVRFFASNSQIGSAVTLDASGNAQITTSTLPAGGYTISASYSGDGSGNFSPSVGFLNSTQRVNQASTTTLLLGSNSSVPTGFSISFRATVSPVAPGAGIRTGTVDFIKNGQLMCSNVPINTSGDAFCNITFGSSGTFFLDANYSGDANFIGGRSQGFSQEVVGPNVGATATTITSSANPSIFGQSVTFTSLTKKAGANTDPASGGRVQFYDGATPIGGLLPVNAAGQATLTISTLSLGNHTITAQYAPHASDPGFNPSTGTLSNGQTVTLTPTAATVSISGRVVSITGHGIANVLLSLTDSSGQIRTATTTSFGYYQFDDVQAGETYILSATGKHYTFSQPLQVLNINEETNEVNFTANSEKRTRVF